MKRLVFSEDVNSITLVDDLTGAFLVPSEMGKRNYLVYFRAPLDNDIPRCECIEWQRNYLPCKHLLAIIQDKSPFLSLDMDILFKPIDHSVDKVDDKLQSCDLQTDFLDHEKEAEDSSTKQTAGTTAELPKKCLPNEQLLLDVVTCCPG